MVAVTRTSDITADVQSFHTRPSPLYHPIGTILANQACDAAVESEEATISGCATLQPVESKGENVSLRCSTVGVSRASL